MNTLNNQQINPGNRVDFSRIRLFAKGGVPKFNSPAGTLSNTSNNAEDFWTNFNNDIITRWGQIAGDLNFNINDVNTFLQQNRNLARTTGYDGTRAVYGQGVKQYQQDFHNKYGFGNTDSFWSGMNAANNALNTGDSRQASGQLFRGDDYFGTQTDYRRANYFSAEELARANEAVKNRGWLFVLNDAQNEGHTVGSDGRQFYKLQEIPLTTTTSTTPTTVTDTTTEESSVTPNEFQSSEYLPEYRKGIWTDGLHLAGIYGNNMIGALRNYNLDMKKRVPLQQAVQQNAIVTDGYTERMLNRQALAEARARNAAAASNTSNADAARQMLLDFESQAGMQNEMQNNAIQAREYKASLQNAQQVADQNTANRTTVSNQNRSNLIADHNAKIDARRKLNATKTAETAGLIQNLDTSLNKFNLQEKMNKLYYNQAVNDYMFNKEKSSAYNEYNDILENGHLRAGYEGLMDHLLNGGGDSALTNNAEDFATLQENRDDFTKTRTILEKYAKNNPEIAAFLSEVDELQKLAWGSYEKKYKSLLANKSYANLFQKQYLGSYPSFNRDFLNTNWTTLFPSYKKGGKVEDRFIKYVEHTRKVLKDQDDRNKHVQTQALKKLLRDLDALDRETLLLLRSIFK